MANLMGFKKITSIPSSPYHGPYDDLLEVVAKTADMYALDTHDSKRCNSLSSTLRHRIKKLGLPLNVIIRGTIVVVVHKCPDKLADEVSENGR